MYLTAECQI